MSAAIMHGVSPSAPLVGGARGGYAAFCGEHVGRSSMFLTWRPATPRQPSKLVTCAACLQRMAILRVAHDLSGVL